MDGVHPFLTFQRGLGALQMIGSSSVQNGMCPNKRVQTLNLIMVPLALLTPEALEPTLLPSVKDKFGCVQNTI